MKLMASSAVVKGASGLGGASALRLDGLRFTVRYVDSAAPEATAATVPLGHGRFPDSAELLAKRAYVTLASPYMDAGGSEV